MAWDHLLSIYNVEGTVDRTLLMNAVLDVESGATYSDRGGFIGDADGLYHNFNGGTDYHYARRVWYNFIQRGLDGYVTSITHDTVVVPKSDAEPPPTTTGTVTFHMDNNRGRILVDGATYSDSQTASFTIGQAYRLRGGSFAGYKFESWTPTGGVSVGDLTAWDTTMTVTGDGTLTLNHTPVTYTPTISVSPTTIPAGTDFTVTGSGFNPALPVDVYTTDLYGNNLQFPSSKSPDAKGNLSITITLDASITYSGTGYVIAKQSGGIESNHFQVSISSAVLPVHRYYTRYVRIDSGTLPAYVTFYVKDLTANINISQDTLTLNTSGKRLCFKGSADVYDSHQIRFSVRNAGTSTIGVTFGLAYNANAAMSGNAPSLTAGSESAAVDVGPWSIFSAVDFDYLGCEGVGPPPPGSECDAKFPNRQTNLWEMIGWGVCVGVNAVMSVVIATFQPIFDTISKMLSPFLQPFINIATAITGLATRIAVWVSNPRAAISKFVAYTWELLWTLIRTPLAAATELWTAISKPITDALGKIKIEFPDWLGGFQTWLANFPALVTSWLEWFTNPGKKIRELAVAWFTGASPSPVSDWMGTVATGTKDAMQGGLPLASNILGKYAMDGFLSQIQKMREDLLTLAQDLKDLPRTFETETLKKLLQLEADMWGLATLAEVSTIGQVEIFRELLDIMRQRSGFVEASKIHLQAALDASIGIASEQYWNNQFRKKLPGIQDAINQVVKEVITVDQFKTVMGLLGYDATQSQRIWDAHFIAPARQELVTALRRGKISREAWNRLKILVDLDPRYDRIDSETGEAGRGSFSIWNEMVYEDPSIMNLRFMFESGSATDEELPVYLKALGYRPEHIPAMETYIKEYQSRFFRRRQLTLLARLEKTGKITEDEFIARAKAIFYTEKTARYELENQELSAQLGTDTAERATTLGMLNTWYIEDIIDAATYRDSAHTLLYTDETIDRQLAYLDKKKAPPPPTPEKIAEATRAMYDTYYMEDVIDATAWRAFYVAQKYPAEVIDLQLALLDKRKTPVEPPPVDLETERDLLQSEAITAFKKHIIDEPTLRDRLDKLGRSDDAIAVLVAIAKADMATEQRDATIAVYAKAYRQGVILRSDYLAKLIDNDYMPDAAELIVKTEELSWGTGVETLTQTQILNSWELGFLDDETVQKRLKAMGLADVDMRILLSNSVLDQLKAKHLTSLEADKKWSDFGVGPDTRARLLAWYGWTPT